MTTIRIDKLRKTFDEHVAIAETSLTLESGKFVVFLGPSGCGKTTTLNCIAGFEEATSGRILFNEEDVTSLPPHARNIAMVFQSALLYPHLSARKNVEMSLAHSGLSAEDRQQRMSHVEDMLKIGHLMHKRPGQLSGGERQRVALAKATVRQPSVFLMDEPFSALDAALRQSLRADLVHLQRQLGVTTIFVTHDQVEAMTMGDVIVVMNHGTIQQVGTPSEIYNAPANKFVAGFIGSPSMNFFAGSLSQNEDRLKLLTPNCSFDLPDHLAARATEFLEKDRKVFIGVRPQHMRIVDDSFTGPTVRASVYGVERLGKENVVILKSGEDVIRILTSPDVAPQINTSVSLSLDLNRTYIFEN